MVSTQQMIAGLDRQVQLATNEVAALEKLQRGISQDVARIDDELAQAWVQLTEVLVPALDAAVLDRASALLRLPAIRGNVVEESLRQTVANNRQRLVKAGNDPSYVNREAVANEAAIRINEVEEAMKPLAESTRELEYEKYFEELLQYRYGTPEYGVRFWQALYYTHWKHADLVVEKHGARMKAQDFKDIAAKYVEEKAALRSLEAVKQSQKEKLKAAQAAEALVHELHSSIEQAVPRALASVRGRVREHLMPLDDATMAELLEGVPDADLAYRRVIGMKKKKEYLTALVQQQLKQPLSDLNAMRNKLMHDRAKLSRPKNWSRSWSQHDYDRRFGTDRSEKWRKRRDRIHDTRTHIVEYHHYDRWSPASDLLWWDLMTDGRIDGNFIDEVRDRPQPYVHHSHQPVATFDADDHRDNFADVS